MYPSWRSLSTWSGKVQAQFPVIVGISLRRNAPMLFPKFLCNIPLFPRLARRGAKERREHLNNYAAAMNEVRKPLNMSLHHVLGVYAKLSAAPIAPVPEKAPTTLTEAEYLGIQETLSKLVRAWRPAAQGKSFLWRDVIDETSLDVRLYQAETALHELRSLAHVIDMHQLSKDPEQRFIYMADGVNEVVKIVDRQSLQELTRFGDGGRYPGQFYGVHSIATDSKGNIYTTETYRGQRVQKFVYKGMIRLSELIRKHVIGASTINP